MMDAATLGDRIGGFLREHFPMARKRNLKPTDKLLESGILDSLGVLDLVAFLEEEFQVVVSDEELLPENFQTIENLIAFVRSKQNGEPGHIV